MRNYWILVAAVSVTGCATHRPVASITAAATSSPKPLVREAVATRVVETRYEVRSYRDPDDPRVWHDAHAVYRATRVPAQLEALETTPRNKAAPISYAPLPPSAELAAEIATQKEIGAELRAIRSRMAVVEQQARAQLGTLADQTEETVNLRRQLEEERTRVRELESKVSEHVAAPPAMPPPQMASGPDPKW
jgi:hypothetical protein